jgi:hypothetical protein
MAISAGQGQHCSDLQCYEIRLQGHLDSRWASRMDGLAFAFDSDGTTTLSGMLADQAALHGLLSRIRDLGLSIVSIQRICREGEGETHD